MSFYDLLRPLAFSVDPERIHEAGIKAISKGVVSGRRVSSKSLQKTCMGITFPNLLGLAAGFDKNGVCATRWKDFGFGFAELGTVTRYPQPGNQKPRLWRIPESQALINRLGFNNHGADAMAKTLEAAFRRDFPEIPIGINLGKSKVTALEDAAKDYAYSFERLKAFGDYFVVNVSSPNTPGLRSLQSRDALAPILEAIRGIDAVKPLLVKVAPELNREELEDVAAVCKEFGVNGYVATNTTLSRPGVTPPEGSAGGLSGKPLFELSTKILSELREIVGPEPTIIGVGGVFSGKDVLAKLEAGADLVQVYTGFVYRGPEFAAECLEALL